MASFTAPLKVDPLLKGKFLALRDALGHLPTEQAMAILEAARAQAVPTSPTPVTTGTTPPVPSTRPPERLLNRPVPSGLVGIFARLLDRAQDDTSRVRAALVRATKFL